MLPDSAADDRRQDIVVLHWPDEERRADEMAQLGQPRLLLVAPDADPPVGGYCEEDWVRLPVDDRDLHARLKALSTRAHRHPQTPELTDDGVLRFNWEWVALSHIEQCLVRPLVENFGQIVSDNKLLRAAWPDRDINSNMLRVRLTRLRQRIQPLGLTIQAARSRGQIMSRVVVHSTMPP